MNPRICVCCGEIMGERGNALSRNPNMCSSCSSLSDGMEDDISTLPAALQKPQRQVEAQSPESRPEEVVWAVRV
jgi:hypothetical protein